ncbi:MAG: hypothetical protein H2057_03520 [Alphaproteobacteria bacterium]|nr:hypothetical protein [Alphaproteobacteria bacterium]
MPKYPQYTVLFFEDIFGIHVGEVVIELFRRHDVTRNIGRGLKERILSVRQRVSVA